jgi:Nuclease-related domain
MFNNALIPTPTGKLTEIDCLIIGTAGIFLIEIKTWQGSFSAYKDKWKRREGSK